MDRKYELLKDDYINYRGITLYRIKALKDFKNIKAGELGGYVESEKNLSHDRNCWVYDNAKVYGNAQVYDNAEILNNAEVFGEAWVYEDAKVFGDAKVYGDAEVCGEAWVYEDAKVYGNAKVYGDAEVCGNAKIYGTAFVCGNANVYEDAQACGDSYICGNAKIYGSAFVCENAEVYGSVIINKGHIIGKVSMFYKDIFQHQCKNRMLTAILTENDRILYSIGCQENLTKEEFIDRIHNEDGGLKENPHRAEYLRLIETIEIYFENNK